MTKRQFLQDPFLNTLRQERIPVFIYLINGIKLHGQIESFDQFVILLKNTVSQMVYKHAISTVVPSRPIFHYSSSRSTTENLSNHCNNDNIQNASSELLQNVEKIK